MPNLVHHVAGVCNALDGEAGVRPSVDGGPGLARQLQQALPGGGQAPALLGRKLDEVVALPARAAVLHASQRRGSGTWGAASACQRRGLGFK